MLNGVLGVLNSFLKWFNTFIGADISSSTFGLSGIYADVLDTMNSVFMVFASTMAVIGLYINFIRSNVMDDIRSNMTLEKTIQLFGRYIIVYFVLVNISTLMKAVLGICTDIASLITTDVSFTWEENDSAVDWFTSLLGDLLETINPVALILEVILVICIYVCMFSLFKAAIMRIGKIYILMAVAPLAISTATFGGGMSQTAWSFTRTFIGECAIVVIWKLILSFFGPITAAMDTWLTSSGVANWFLSVLGANVLYLIVSVAVITALIKGSERFMTKAFNL